MKSKRLLLLLLLAIGLPWAANAQTVTIGTGTSTQNMSPMANYYDLSFTEMIYTAEEIAAGNPTEDNILSVGFQLASNGLNNKTYSIAVYMKNYDADEFGTATFVSFASTDAVFTGTVTATTSGWVTIDLDSPFAYDNTKNLLIGVNKTAGGYAGSAFNWNYTSTSKYQHLYKQQDGTNVYDPTNPPTSPTRNYNRPNVQLTFGVPPTCFAPKNLTCTEYTATSATLTWQRHASGTENAWVLQYSTDNTFATGVQSVNVSNTPSTQLTDLTAETKYYARVRPDCDENLWSDVCEFKPSAAQTVTIGSGTGTTYYFPSNTNYDYSYTQQIYTAAEIGQIGAIKSVSFKGNRAGTRTFVVYMANTTKETFADKTDVIPIADATQVFSGSVTFTANEWKTIELAGDGFDYDGGNLAIIVDDNSGNYTMGSTNWAAFSTSGNQALYFFRDNNDIDPTIPASSNNSVTTSKNQIILSIIPSNTPKPRNIQVSDITASQATVSWEAPATGTPTGYEYQIKVLGEEWPTSWISAGNNLSVEPTGLTASTDYVVRVRAIYAEGESGSIETEFRTLDACAFPTNLLAYTAPGEGTKATLSWRKGYDETAWVLQYATNNTFTEDLVELTSGFIPQTDPGLENVVVAVLNGLTPDQTYYARVKADCGGGSTSTWSNVATFTPSNYVDFTFKENATSSTTYTPFYGSSTTNATNQSQCVIPASELVDLTGGIIRRITYYTSSTTTTTWGGVTFNVYMAEVDNTEFPSTSPTFYDWTSLTNVYTGTVSLSNGMMAIDFDNNFTYNGGNLLIGFKTNTVGTAVQYINWTANYESTYNELHQYGSNNAARSRYLPKITFNYQPTPYKKPVIDEASCTAGTTTAHIAWTVTGATPTGYQYQYKSASATEWPTAWTSATTTYADLSDLTPSSFYDFRVKALYDGGNESVVVDYGFFTECDVITAFPWKETFESYPANTNTAYDETYKFDHPCWVNEHLVDGTGSSGSMTLFQVCSALQNGNSTHKLQLPDMKAGTVTGLRLPEMTLASGTDYQFVLDINRNTNSKPTEGIRVFVSTNGELEGATELCFISRDYTVASAPYIPAEEASGWYTYELPLGIQGTCYIILRGESQYGSATYMDNLIVEEIPTCARPSELAYSDVTNHSAKLSWTAGDTEQTLWQIAYSKTNFDPNTANFDVTTLNTVDATANPYTFAGTLDAESTYYMYVRANCGTATEPDFGPWSRKGINFTTLAATPAPSNFVASNPASAKVDLVWNAGGGDTESWELYYVASETAPEAPTASTTATVSNITTLPTNEAPYVLESLNPVTKYYAWVRAKHVWNNEATYSDWVALTGNYFETLDACPTPTDLVATNLTSVSADLSWVGSDDVTEGYTVEYGEEGTYSMNETVDFSGLTTAGYSSEGVLPEGWMRYNSNSGYMPHVSDKSAYSYIDEFGDDNNYLLMTQNKNSNQYLYAIMPQINDLGSFEFKYVYESISQGEFSVGYVTDNTDYSTYHVLQTPTKSASIATCTLTGDNIATINANNGYVTFCYQGTSTTFYSVGIDDIVYKGGTYTPGATQTVQSEGTSITIDGLTPDKTYTVKVKSNCTNGEWSNMASFTTLAEGNMVFTNATNDGKWGNSGNWAPAQLPVLTDEVILRANATIESGCVAEAKKINLNSNTLTIADGGQLKTDNSVTATVKKSITGYGAGNEEDKANYYLIGNPLSSTISPSYTPYISATGMLTGNYDLYQWSRTSDLEWSNYEVSTFSLSNGTGYLYANESGVELSFTGMVKANNTVETKTPSYTAPSGQTEFSDWNLYANPFVCDAYLSTEAEGMAFYRMNDAGDGFTTATGAIKPMEGFFVQATASSQSVNISRQPASKSSQLNMNLRSNNKQLDNAILVFGEGQNLGKFSFRQGSSKVYMPVEGNDYAALFTTEAMGALPVNFKAENNGTYTLSFNAEEVSFAYLHLIDNMTGEDVDLLAGASTGSATYTFDARTTDYESRFKLVFATGNNANDDAFAFYSNGSFVINNEGNATVQVIDVNGRILKSESINGCANVNVKAAAGVYMLRLVNGNDVKVQKVVVR